MLSVFNIIILNELAIFILLIKFYKLTENNIYPKVIDP